LGKNDGDRAKKCPGTNPDLRADQPIA
jgi:hypothetical protein